MVSEIILVDVNKNSALGEAADIIQGTPLVSPVRLSSGEYEDAADSDIVIFALGLRRKPGMTRLDLFSANVDILRNVVPAITRYAPDAIYIVVSNPVDLLTYAVQKISGLPANRVIGSGTLLDTCRLRTVLSERTGVSTASIHAYVLAEHGDTSFIPWSLASIFGMNAVDYVRQMGNETGPGWKEEILDDVRKAGARVIANKGATFFAVSLSVCEICRNILGNTKRIMPVGKVLEGECGLSGACVSLPYAIGAQGLTGSVFPNFSPDEQAALEKSVESLKPYCQTI
jgi:L-lactate dehydrogenase